MRTVHPASTGTALRRVQALRAVVEGHARNPYIQGRAMQIAGIALLADGLVGIKNPLGRGGRSGLVGSVVTVAISVAVLILVPPLFDTDDPYPGGVTTTGTVTSVQRGETASAACGAVVRYTVGDRSYEVGSAYSSSTLCELSEGATLEVSYLQGDPAAGRVRFPPETLLLWLVAGFGTVVLAVGAWSLLRCLTEAGLGAWLWWSGRRRVRGAPSVPVGDLIEHLAAAWDAGDTEPLEFAHAVGATR